MAGMLGTYFLHELNSAPWGIPQLRNIEEIGCSVGTNTGTRRSRNEDRFAVGRVSAVSGEVYALAVLCDGVGGSLRGDEAAASAIAFLTEELACLIAVEPLGKIVDRVLRRVDDRVRSSLNGQGVTTISLIIATSSGDVIAANVGDSRIFAVDKLNKALVQLSVDDTMENALKDLVNDVSAINAKGLGGSLSQAIGEAALNNPDTQHS